MKKLQILEGSRVIREYDPVTHGENYEALAKSFLMKFGKLGYSMKEAVMEGVVEEKAPEPETIVTKVKKIAGRKKKED